MSTPNPVNQLRGRLGQMVATKAPAEKIAEVRAGKHVTATEIAGVES